MAVCIAVSTDCKFILSLTEAAFHSLQFLCNYSAIRQCVETMCYISQCVETMCYIRQCVETMCYIRQCVETMCYNGLIQCNDKTRSSTYVMTNLLLLLLNEVGNARLGERD